MDQGHVDGGDMHGGHPNGEAADEGVVQDGSPREGEPSGLRARLRSVASTLRLATIFACIGLVVIFTLQNTAAVRVDFLFWSITLSRALLVFLLIVVGTAFGWLLRSVRD